MLPPGSFLMTTHTLDLLDYRRTTFDLYRTIREAGSSSPEAYATFRATRDALFANHSQSPLSDLQRQAFDGLKYCDYDPAYRVMADVEADVEPVRYDMQLGDDGSFTMVQVAQVSFDLPTGRGQLGVFWIEGYGGGIFVPFRDATNSESTYGGGRYLYDSIKGADLGATCDNMLLDFNYAYHPSCYYNERWVCPLAPPQNKLTFPVVAGERLLEE